MGQRITGAKVKGTCRRFLAVFGGSMVLAVVALGGMAAPAQADLLGGTVNSLGALTGVPGTPASSLDAAFKESPANLAAALACPVVKGVAGVTSGVPVVGTVVDQLPTVICAVNILGYAYRTTYVRPDGTKVVRIFHALAGVPTLLDVTGDGVPDFTGTLTVSLTLNGISLNVTRLLLPASTPVSVEAVALDPATPQTYVGFGEDGTTSGTGGSWTTSINVFGIGGGSVDLGLGMNTSLGRPSTLGLLGEVLSGNTADAPTTTSRGDVFFTPVPSQLTTEIKVSQGRQEAIVTSPTPSTVNAHVNLITSSDEKDIDGTIDQLPTSVDVVHETQAGHETTTYTANAPVNQVNVDYHDHMGSTIPTAARFTANHVPTGLTLDQVAQTTSLTTAGGSVGSIFASVAELAADAAVGSTPPTPALPSTPDFAAYRESVAGFTAEAQFSGLVSAVYTASPVSATVTANTANEALLTYQKDIAGGPAKASVDITKIPSQVTVAMDPTGKVTYGASSDISSIVAKASNLPQFPTVPGGSQQLQNVGVTITGVPQALSGGMAANGELVFAAGTAAGGPAGDPQAGGLGSIGVTASSASAPALTIPGTPDYAAYRQDASGFNVAGQFSGLAKIDVLPTPLNATVTTNAANEALLTYEKDTAAGAAKASVDVNKIPSQVTVGMDPTGKVTYGASSDITSIVATASGLPQFPTVPGSSQQLQKVGIAITGVPQALSGGMAANGELVFAAGTAAGGPASDPQGGGLGSIGVTAASANAPALTIPGTPDYAAYRQDASGFGVAGQFSGLGKIDVLPTPLNATVTTNAANEALLTYERDTTAGAAKASLDINRIPSTVAVSMDPTGRIAYGASSDIGSIVATASGLPQFPTVPGTSQQLQNVGVTITGVPQALSGGMLANGELRFDAGTAAGGPAGDPDAAGLGAIEATASSASAPSPTIPGTASYAAFKQDDSGFAGHVKLGGPGGTPVVSHVDILPSPVDATIDSSALQQVGINADRNVGGRQLNVSGTLASTISELHLFQTNDSSGTSYELDSGGGAVQSFTLSGTAGGGALPHGVTSFGFGLHDVPPAAKVTIGSGASDLVSARFGAFDTGHNFVPGPIGEITASINGGSAPTSYTDSRGVAYTGTDGLRAALDSANNIINAGFDLHGLRGLSFGSQPFTQAGIDIDPARGRPMALGFSQQQASGPDLTATGIIDKLPANLTLKIQPSADVPIQYSAGGVINELEVQTNYGMSSGVPKAIVRVNSIPKNFTVCFRTDGQPPSCEPSNAFDAGNGNAHRLIGAAFETDQSANPSVHLDACFDSGNPCGTGTKELTVDVPNIPNTLEMEFGATAQVGSGPDFQATCIDPYNHFSLAHPIDSAENAASMIGCIASFPVTWLAAVIGGTGASAQAWMNTAGQPLNATAVYTDPVGGIFTQPVVLTFTLPTLSADRFYTDDAVTLGGGFTSTHSGTLACAGGGLNLATAIGIPVHSFDIGFLVDPINSIISDLNDLPDVDIPSIPTSVTFGGQSEPISFDLIPSFC
ncbi:MAG: hypothetical protein QOH12_3440 [Solirubrobacteraceae bacterium]|nr:hypothetical protein [Solirubrobacteraceae bacterium]